MKFTNKRQEITIILAVTVIAVLALALLMVGEYYLENDTTPNANTTNSRDLFPDKAVPEFATLFSVEYHGTYKVVQTYDPHGAGNNHTYVLVQRGEKAPEGYQDAQIIYIPVQSVITTSVVNVAYLDELNETSAIVGNIDNNVVLNETFQQRVKEGKIADVGNGVIAMSNNYDAEKMIDLSPEIVFCLESGNQQQDNQQKLVEAGLRPVLTEAASEATPLGRAEWIKYYALFFNKEKEANTVFDQVKFNYLDLESRAQNASSHPTIIAGMGLQGIWYVPGNESYESRFFEDAGGDYVLSDLAGGNDMPTAFETVYDRGYNASFFLDPQMISADSIQDLIAQDPRYAKFQSVQNGAVYEYDARKNGYGGVDYWESAFVHPDIVLADIIKILHPELLPDHQLYYYRQVNATR